MMTIGPDVHMYVQVVGFTTQVPKSPHEAEQSACSSATEHGGVTAVPFPHVGAARNGISRNLST